jgi:hypothetical protein
MSLLLAYHAGNRRLLHALAIGYSGLLSQVMSILLSPHPVHGAIAVEPASRQTALTSMGE